MTTPQPSPPPPGPTRTAPVIITPTHLNTSGGDWVECSYSEISLRVQILLQPQMANCGPAALCTLVRLCTGEVITAGMMGARVRAAGKKDVPWREAINFGSDGSDFYELLRVLTAHYSGLNARECDISTNPGRLPLSKQLENFSSPTKPALCHIAWSKGGHFTICLGAHGGKLLWADPYYGAVVTVAPSTETDALMYDTARNSAGVAPGHGTIRYAILTVPPPRT